MAKAEEPKPQEVITRFERSFGGTTIKTTVYRLPLPEDKEEIRPWIEAERIRVAQREAEHRAEQLEPPKPKRERIIRREPGVYIGEDEAALMRGQALR